MGTLLALCHVSPLITFLGSTCYHKKCSHYILKEKAHWLKVGSVASSAMRYVSRKWEPMKWIKKADRVNSYCTKCSNQPDFCLDCFNKNNTYYLKLKYLFSLNGFSW